MKPQIHEATPEVDDKIRLRVFPRSRNVQEPTESHRKSRRKSHKRFHRRTPRTRSKVITYLRSRSHNAEFGGAGYQEVGLG